MEAAVVLKLFAALELISASQSTLTGRNVCKLNG